jgi:predicted secreted protein
MHYQVLALAVLVAGCVSEPRTQDLLDGKLAPPSRDEIALKLMEKDNGTEVSVSVGSTFSISLVGVPTAGYVWTVIDSPSFIQAEDAMTGPTIVEQTEPMFTGGNHWEVQTFRVLEVGQGQVKLVQKRAWEEEFVDSFEVSIVAN